MHDWHSRAGRDHRWRAAAGPAHLGVRAALGCGKTLLGIEFLKVRAMRHNEPGVFLAFEETAEELAQNVRSLGFDLG